MSTPVDTRMTDPVADRDQRPGWGIVVDLTPPEVRKRRQVRGLQRGIGAALVVVLALCALASWRALEDRSAAQDAYDAEQAKTVGLDADLHRYADITAIQQAISDVDDRVAGVMAGDVDFVNLMARIRVALPPRVTISDESVSLIGGSADPTADTATSTGAAAPVLVGSVTLSGSAATIDDVASFVTVLSGMVGVSDVVPTSTNRTQTGLGYTVSLNLTDKVLTHRFDPAEKP